MIEKYSKEDLIEFLERYKENAAGFTKHFTKLWYDPDGTPQEIYPKQLLFLNARNLPRIRAVLKCRQCIWEESVVYTEDGPKQIKDMLDYRGRVWTLNEEFKPVLDRVLDVWEVGDRNTFEIKLATGERLVATEKHKINTNNGWKMVADLKVGDIVHNFESKFGSYEPSDDEVVTMAYFITDGSYTNANPKFTNINNLYLEEFDKCVKNEFGVETRWQKKGNGFDICVRGGKHGTNKPSKYAKYLMELNMRGVTGKDRVLPNKFLNMTKEKTALLLNRMFAADGWVTKLECGNEVGIASLSLEFLYQVSYMLSKFGIHCRIVEDKSGKKQKQRFWKLRFGSYEYVSLFFNEIGIYGKQPKNTLVGEHIIHKNRNRIVSIKEVGEKKVYDLTTEKYHSYIANGIHVHNSGFSSSIVGKVVHSGYYKKSPEILVVSKSATQAEKALDRVRKAFNSMPEAIRPEFLKETQTELRLANGVNIYSLAPNPDNTRGFTGDVFLDEMGAFGAKVGEELWEAIAPATTKGYSITVVGTPKGKGNLFYKLCTMTASEIAQVDVPFDNWRLKVHWSDVPHISRNVDLERAKYTPLMWAQEFELEFLDNSEELYFTQAFIEEHCYTKAANDFGFLNVRYKGHVENEIREEDKVRYLERINEVFSEIYVGWDMARVQDQSIVVVLGRRKDDPDIIQLIDIHELGGLDYETQSRCVSIIAQLVNAKKVGYDNTGRGDVIREFLNMTKIASRLHAVNFSPKTKIPMYTNMRTLMGKQQLWIPNTRVVGGDYAPIAESIEEQLVSLEYNPIMNRIEAQVGKHDDIPSALICGLEAAKKQKVIANISYIKRK